jgi:hypothetical protein
MIIWLHSAAARAGIGPPQWIVIGIMVALVCVAGFEGSGLRSGSPVLVLSRRDKAAAAALVGLTVVVAALAWWR